MERSAQLTDDAVRRADRGVAAAAAAFDAGDTAWALRLLDEATAGTVPAGTRSRAGALRGAITTRSGALDEAWAILVAAAREVAETDPSRALHLVAEAVDVAFYLADGDVARESQRLAESLLDRGVGGSAAGVGRLAVGMAQVLDGQDGSVSLREGFALLGGEDARPTDEFDATWLMISALFLREEGSTRRLLRAVEEARADTSVGGLPHLLFHLARDEATTDRWAAAVTDYAEAAALAEELGQTTEEAMSLAGLAWLEARRGNDVAVRRHAERAVALAEPRRVMIARIWAGFALGDLELGAGRMDEARDRYRVPRRAPRRVADPRCRPLARPRAGRGAAPHRGTSSGRPRWLPGIAAMRSARASRGRWPGPGAPTGLLAGDDEIDAAFGTALTPPRRDTRRLRDRPDQPGVRVAVAAGPAAGRRAGPAGGRLPGVRAAGGAAVGRRRRGRAGGDGRDRRPARCDRTGPAHAPRAADRPAARRRPHHAGDGGRAVPQPEDGGVPPASRLHEARHHQPQRAGRPRGVRRLTRPARRRSRRGAGAGGPASGR